MKTIIAPDVVTHAVARELAAAWTARVGTPAEVAAGDLPTSQGWTVSVPLSGVSTGQVTVWVDLESAAAGTRQLLGVDADPTADASAEAIGTWVLKAADAMVSSTDGAGLMLGAPSTRKAAPPAGTQAFVLKAGEVTWPFGVSVDLGSNAAGAMRGAESRQDNVLDVDLPLVVRFGRAVMPLRAVADLATGSVVDMGRAPDEPVELMVGERLIARGEVVVVGGNYGVRITELTSGRRSADREARS